MKPQRSPLNTERPGAMPDLLLRAFDARSLVVLLIAFGGAALVVTVLDTPLPVLLAVLAVAAAALSWLAAAALALLAVVVVLAAGASPSVLDIALLLGVPVLVAVLARREAVPRTQDAGDVAQPAAAQSPEALCRTILDTALDGMLILDGDGRVLEANAAFCRMLGVERDALLRMHVDDWQAEYTREQVQAMIDDGMLAHGPQRFETVHRRADGSTYLAEVSAQVVSVAGRRRAIASVRDISDAKAAMHAREQDHAQLAARTAQQTALAKAGFLTNVSRYLRTPIHAVLTFAGVGLQQTAGKDTASETCFQRIRLSAEQLSGFVDDLILLTSLQSGARRVSLESINLPAQVSGAQSDLAVTLGSKDLRLAIDVPPHASAMLDATLLRRLLVALLAHACRRSPEAGTIHLVIRDEGASAGTGQVRRGFSLSVRDTGPAVGATTQERLFDAFFEHGARHGSNDPSLALALAAQIVRVHGGTISAQGGEQAGLTFTLWLPRDGQPVAGTDPERDTAVT